MLISNAHQNCVSCKRNKWSRPGDLLNDSQGHSVAYHSQTVRLDLSNLLCLMTISYSGHVSARVVLTYLWAHLEISWVPQRDMRASVKLEWSCTIYTSLVWIFMTLKLHVFKYRIVTCVYFGLWSWYIIIVF